MTPQRKRSKRTSRSTSERNAFVVTSGQRLGNWVLQSKIGEGGNGAVWIANNGDEPVAIKILKFTGNSKAIKRFNDEISAMRRCADIRGVLPVLGDGSSASASPEGRGRAPSSDWFAMPLAESAMTVLADADIFGIVEAVSAWAQTLTAIHERGVSHRDIKPANLFRWKNDWVVGDFGLVRFPSSSRVTELKERVGPWAIMPPEMRRRARRADGMSADVYLLAKTLWMFLMHDNDGFDGPYVALDPALSLEERYGANSFSHPLELLLEHATRNDPSERPTMQRFADSLEAWKAAFVTFHRRALEDWHATTNRVLARHHPQRAIWEDAEEIFSVLQTAVRYDNANHLFYPSRGGNDLERVERSWEPDCVELHANGVAVVRPRRLILEAFRDNPEWNYFRLETGGLQPIFHPRAGRQRVPLTEETPAPDENDEPRSDRRSTKLRSNAPAPIDEEVTEVEVGHYEPASAWDDGHYGSDEDGEPIELPKTARQVSRFLEGAFVIFGKRSPYNLHPGTYDARCGFRAM